MLQQRRGGTTKLCNSSTLPMAPPQELFHLHYTAAVAAAAHARSVDHTLCPYD